MYPCSWGSRRGCKHGRLRDSDGPAEAPLRLSLASFPLPPRYLTLLTAVLSHCFVYIAVLLTSWDWDLYASQLILSVLLSQTQIKWLSTFQTPPKLCRVTHPHPLPLKVISSKKKKNFNESYPSPLCGNDDAILLCQGTLKSSRIELRGAAGCGRRNPWAPSGTPLGLQNISLTWPCAPFPLGEHP